eukprot:CAMPEP_0171912728 /NCGR_PEP_ID=MMETSP0993-20121228/11325_1 /TAXON_ID=483369 /ORGANISM="non described non described, Strain CCMP2098" /LENGTH=96 /DNA_ID=CAMNT_0012546625 /DNA_START=46 /DNA_END=336 /DNA_ORIENTATION=+
MRLMSRACTWVSRPSESNGEVSATTFVASGDEETSQGVVWSCPQDDGAAALVTQRLERHTSPVLQLQHHCESSSNSELLACVSATQLKVHRRRVPN